VKWKKQSKAINRVIFEFKRIGQTVRKWEERLKAAVGNIERRADGRRDTNIAILGWRGRQKRDK